MNDNDYEYGRCVIAAVFESDEIGVYENFTKCKVAFAYKLDSARVQPIVVKLCEVLIEDCL